MLLFDRERKLYAKIVRAVTNPDTCGKIGKSFCRIPSTVVNELKTNGYCVEFFETIRINRYLHNIFVGRKST